MKNKIDKIRLPVHIKPERYEIMLKPDLNEFTFTGQESISLILEKPTKEITLHAIELEIESAQWIHESKETWAGKISYDVKTEIASFIFPKTLQRGKGELKLVFKGILNDKMRGFYRSRYDLNGVSKHMATTQFESTDARRAFPCFDEPNQKAIFDVTLLIPAGTKAISNTIESKIKEHESGFQIVKFAPTPKMSTYLLAFIVGEFEYIESKTKDGVLVRVFTIPGKKDQAKFALLTTKKCLEFYNDYFKIKYPLPILDMIAIPDFAAGAMENWGAVTFRESTLLIDENNSSSANKQWVALVIAHELAHMWFGDLVTMKWWNDLWLNEGFASFIEFLAIDKIYPKFDVWSQFVSTEMADAYSLDALNNTHPIEVEVSDPAEISEIFDRVSYSKGASILRMLWNYLGADVFQKGLQHYLKKHAYSNAETSDLWLALEEISGKPVGKIMANWTTKPGHPLVSIQSTANSLQLTQSRFFSSPISKKESKDETIWCIPLSSLRMQGSNKQVLRSEEARLRTNRSLDSRLRGNDSSILMDKKTILIPNTRKKLNFEEMSLVRIDYPHEYLKNLEKDVQNGKLSSADRLGLIRDSFDLAQSGNSPTTLALELALSYVNDKDYIVWSELTGQISKLESLLAYEPYFENFQNYGRKIYANIAQKMGWKKRAGEKHTDALLRGLVLFKLGSFGDQEVIQKAIELFNAGKVDPDLRGVVYNLVAKNGDKDVYETLVKMYKEEENQQEKDRLGRSLGLFQQKEILSDALHFAISKDVRFQNTLQIIVSVWSNPCGRYLAWDFMKKNWKMLKERYAGGHYFTKAFLAIRDFTKISDAKDIEKFVAKNPVPEARRTIAQALEQIYSNAEWLKRDRIAIKKFLDRF